MNAAALIIYLFAITDDFLTISFEHNLYGINEIILCYRDLLFCCALPTHLTSLTSAPQLNIKKHWSRTHLDFHHQMRVLLTADIFFMHVNIIVFNIYSIYAFHDYELEI